MKLGRRAGEIPVLDKLLGQGEAGVGVIRGGARGILGAAQVALRLLELLEIRLLAGGVTPKGGRLPPVADLPGQGGEEG